MINKQNKWTKEKVIEESKKYSSRTEFCHSAKGAYVAAQKHGWLSEMPWLKYTRRQAWTKEEVIAEARKYTTVKEFVAKATGAYQAALKNDWMRDLSWLNYGSKSWTRETVIAESRKYKTRTEFSKGSMGAYLYAKKHNILDEMTWLPLLVHSKWTKEECVEESKKYTTRKDFSEHSSGAYTAALKNGWLEEMDWLDTSVREPYTRDEVLSIARQYTTKIAFRRAVPNVYNCAQKKGWLEDITWFIVSPKYDRHNYCIYVYTDEEEKVAYVGLTVDKKRRHYNHSTGYDKGGKVIKSAVFRYFQSIGKPVPNPRYLEERLTASEAREKEDEWVKKYKEMGYYLLNKGKTGAGVGALGSASFKWTKPKVFEEARKYQSRSEFASKCVGAYTVACKRGWIEQMPWMKEKWSHPSPKWTKDAVFEESKKYSSRREFEDGASSAYSKALQYGWLDDMSWLKIKRKSWSKEEVFEESRKYNSRVAFAEGTPGAYGIARREKWLDEMPWLVKKGHGIWTKEEVFEESKKYASRTAFAKGNETAYRIALRKGWINDIFPKNK